MAKKLIWDKHLFFLRLTLYKVCLNKWPYFLPRKMFLLCLWKVSIVKPGTWSHSQHGKQGPETCIGFEKPLRCRVWNTCVLEEISCMQRLLSILNSQISELAFAFPSQHRFVSWILGKIDYLIFLLWWQLLGKGAQVLNLASHQRIWLTMPTFSDPVVVKTDLGT